MHLLPPQGEEYEQLVDLLAQNRCTTFIGYPNVNSLYLWSGLEPPPPMGPERLDVQPRRGRTAARRR